MNEFDKQRIENAIWTLEQYRDEIISRSDETKLDSYEIEAMFRTLSYVRGLATK